MAKVKIYTKSTCPYCIRAKALLNAKAVSYEEIDVGAHPEFRPEMERLSGRHTVPQIFINGQSVGGCDDIHALDAQGKLDLLLQEK